MAAGQKIWRKSPDPIQRSGWGLSTRLKKSMLNLSHSLTVSTPNPCLFMGRVVYTVYQFEEPFTDAGSPLHSTQKNTF